MYYYPLLEFDGLTAEVGLSNFSPSDFNLPPAAFVYSTYSDGSVWHLFYEGELSAFQTRTFSRQTLHCPQAPLRGLFVFLYPTNDLPSQLDRLPTTPYHVTSPDWRGNLKLCSATTCTSYMGEYPAPMLSLDKSTLVSIGPLTQFQAGITTSVFVVNLLASPARKPTQVYLIDLKSQHIIASFDCGTNQINLITLPPCEDAVYLMSKDMVGIPIYFSYDSNFSQLSLEHTHPPHEFTTGGYIERHALIRDMKRWWISHAKIS